MHDSVIFYADARVVDCGDIEGLLKLKGDIVVQCDDCSDRLLQTIQQGLFASEATPNKIIKYCQGLEKF